MTSPNKVYARQILALAPFTDNFSKPALIEKITKMETQEKNNFLMFLLANSLGSAWTEKLGGTTINTLWPPEQVKKLRVESKRIAVIYLQQIVSLYKISQTLEQHSIPHAVFKGAHTRELVYPNPVTRPSADIDILINEKDKEEVIRVLTSQDYTLHIIAQNLTHEASLINGNTSIDLHWHILRPGRIPKSLTAELLRNRTQYGKYWSLSNEENLFILLIHPVFSKYSSATQSGLVRMLDLIYWLKTQPIDWEKLLELLKRTGLRTTAWVTLEYLHTLTGVSIPQQIANQLAPNKLKKKYLQTWIYTDLPSRLQHWPFSVKIAFTLFAHDNIIYASRFLRILFIERLRQALRS